MVLRRLAFDRAGNLFVADKGNYSIDKFFFPTECKPSLPPDWRDSWGVWLLTARAICL